MAIWIAILLGIIQGIFMFFPVSSTSHMTLMEHLLGNLGFDLPPSGSPEMILFKLMVHVATLISIAVVFRKSISIYLRNSVLGFLEWMPGNEKSERGRMYVKLTMLGLLSVMATGLIGFPLKAIFESVFEQPLIISLTLAITGVLLWWTDKLPSRKVGLKDIGVTVALVIGVAQGLALLPGLSRSGLTIAFALFLGVQRRWAAEYSFFIAFPTILGAALMQTIEVMKIGGLQALDPLVFVIAFVVSAVVGILALYLVLHLLYKAKFRFFAYYVWVLAIVVAAGALYGNL